MGGRRNAKARSAPKGCQDPDLRGGAFETSGCVSLYSAHFRVISPGALAKWEIWSLDFENACLQGDSCNLDVRLRAPAQWDQSNPMRIWKLRASGYFSNDAPVAICRSLRKNLLNSDEPLAKVRLLCRVSKRWWSCRGFRHVF